MRASRTITRTLLAAFACAAIAIGLALCAMLATAAADEPSTAIPYPQGKTFTYDGTEKNVAGVELIAGDDGFILNDGVAEADMGSAHTAARTNTGDLYIWGSNTVSQLGIAGISESLKPVKVLSGVKNIDVSVWHSAAVTDNGDLYLWGDNYYGEVGAGYNFRYATPVKVLPDVKQVALGRYYSAAITTNGDLYMWGKGDCGQLGVGQRTTLNFPVKVLSNVAQVACGYDHTAAVTTNGDLYTWGNNERGQLGDGTYESRLAPVKVSSISNVAQVSCGISFTVALTTSGEVYTWGHGAAGFLGDGPHPDSYTRNYPEKVPGLENVVEISSGDNHTGALTADGDLYMWGGNTSNKINDSNTQSFYEPTKVLSDIAHVSVGDTGSSAIDTSGKLLTWGRNDCGQLGDGTKVTRGTPTEVEGIVTGDPLVRFYVQDPDDTVYATDAGTYHCYAVPCEDCCWEDGTTDPIEVIWTIRKATYNMSGVTFEDATFEHDGKPHSIEVSGELPEGVTVSYEGNGQVEAGTYPVTAHFAGDIVNHELIPDMTATLTVHAQPRWMRLGGLTRYDTMEAIVKQAFPESSEYAVLVSGKNFPDALSAASLAGAYSCPIVSTDPGSLSPQARRELERLGAKHVIIVGGPAAVSDAAEAAVKDLSCVEDVERVAGQTRYDTSLAVMERMTKKRPAVGIIVASGANFPDALSASPFSYAKGAPILLVNPNVGLTDAQAQAVASVANTGARRAVLMGGTLVVPNSVEDRLRSLGVGDIVRMDGANRYDTAVRFAGWAAANGATLEHPTVATGNNFADALVGAPLAGGKNSVLLLADDQGAGPRAVGFLTEHASEVREGYILGLQTAVSYEMEDRILAATNGILVEPGSSLSGQSADSEAADDRQYTAAQFG